MPLLLGMRSRYGAKWEREKSHSEMSRADKEILRGQTSLFLLSMSSVVWEMPNTSNLFAGKRVRRRPSSGNKKYHTARSIIYPDWSNLISRSTVSTFQILELTCGSLSYNAEESVLYTPGEVSDNGACRCRCFKRLLVVMELLSRIWPQRGGMHAATSHLQGTYTTSAIFSDCCDHLFPSSVHSLIGVCTDFRFLSPNWMQTSYVHCPFPPYPSLRTQSLPTRRSLSWLSWQSLIREWERELHCVSFPHKGDDSALKVPNLPLFPSLIPFSNMLLAESNPRNVVYRTRSLGRLQETQRSHAQFLAL